MLTLIIAFYYCCIQVHTHKRTHVCTLFTQLQDILVVIRSGPMLNNQQAIVEISMVVYICIEEKVWNKKIRAKKKKQMNECTKRIVKLSAISAFKCISGKAYFEYCSLCVIYDINAKTELYILRIEKSF